MYKICAIVCLVFMAFAEHAASATSNNLINFQNLYQIPAVSVYHGLVAHR